MESLKSRIQVLESTIEEQASHLNRLQQTIATQGLDPNEFKVSLSVPNPSQAGPTFPFHTPISTSLQDQASNLISNLNSNPGSSDFQDDQALQSKEDDIQLDKVVFKLTLGDFGEPEYRGPTSSFTWSRRYDEAAGFRFPVTWAAPASPQTYRSVVDATDSGVETCGSFLNYAQDSSPALAELSAADFDEHLSIYFEWQNSCIPVLSQDWLHDRLYQACVSLSRRDSASSMGSLCKEFICRIHFLTDTAKVHSIVVECYLLLLAIVSVSLQFTSPSSPPGDAFFGIATKILREMCMKKPSLTIVQAACILACQSYGSGHVNNAWILNGK